MLSHHQDTRGHRQETRSCFPDTLSHCQDLRGLHQDLQSHCQNATSRPSNALNLSKKTQLTHPNQYSLYGFDDKVYRWLLELSNRRYELRVQEPNAL